MPSPLVTVIIPVYNTEKYLRACLDSVLAQSYQNLQIIAINDGSTDNSLSLLKSYQDSRLEIVDQLNGGLSNARNTGIMHARGDYLCFVDSDDALHPQYVEILLRAIATEKADLAVCSLARFRHEAQLAALENTVLAPASWRVLRTRAAISHLYSGNDMQRLTVACTKLYPRRIFAALRFPEGKIHEDVAVSLDVLLHAPRIAVTDMPLYFYRYNEASIMTTPSWRHIDGMRFYLAHYRKLRALAHPCANDALLAAFKAGITSAGEYWAQYEYRADARYPALLRELQLIARKINLKGLNRRDFVTVITARISIRAAVIAYRRVLQHHNRKASQ